MKTIKQQKFKKGAASMYVVVFAMMLVAIIMLGFMRLMLSEARRTTDSSLSESAYDSALAGVEDAKVLIMKYYQCKKDPSKSGCSRILSLLDSSEFNCNKVIKGLYNSDDKEIQIGVSGGSSSIDDMLDQAYTCVDIALNGDYEGKLSPDTASNVIPIRTSNNSNIKYIQLKWYTNEDMEKAASGAVSGIPTGYISPLNGVSQNIAEPNISAIGTTFNGATLPPTVVAEVFQTAKSGYSRQSFYSSTSSGTNRAAITLVPTTSNAAPDAHSSVKQDPNFSTDPVVKSEALIASASKSPNYPITVHCENVAAGLSTNYACTVYLELPNALDENRNVSSYRGDDTMFLRFSYPLSRPDQVSYHVSLFDSSYNEIDFAGVQPIIDATGRANDLFRRVEARLRVGITPTIDPPAELTVTGPDNGDSVNKKMSITKNCYSTVDGICEDGQNK